MMTIPTKPVAVFKEVYGTSFIYINGVRLDSWTFSNNSEYLKELVNKINASIN